MRHPTQDQENPYYEKFATHESFRHRQNTERDSHSRYDTVNFNRLRRTLHSFIGQNWNSAQSRLLRVFPWPKHTLPLDLLRREVEQTTFLDETGKVMATNRYYTRPFAVKGFFVHPETARLAYQAYPRSSWRQDQAKQLAKTLVILEAHRQLQQIDGIWYAITAQAADTKHFPAFGRLPIEGKPYYIHYTISGKSFFYRHTAKPNKRQLNRNELLAFNLKNH